MKKMTDADLITEYVYTYAKLLSNTNTGRGIMNLSKKEKRLQAELLNRGLITEKNVEFLNM